MTRTPKLFGAAALSLLLGLAACQNDELFTPITAMPIHPLFTRYVSMGNSITAGFQSGGINDSTQRQSYAVLLARAMQSPFFAPYMNRPGCPPPYTNVFTGARLSGGTATTCALRVSQPVPPPYISNTAVPGAEVLDGFANLDTASNPNALTTFFLGGLTQAQMVQRAQPTFVSVWIGNNDVLGAATYGPNAGDSTRITSVANFTTRYNALLDSVARTGPEGAVLVGVANVTAIPYFSTGSAYYAFDVANPLLPFTAAPTCAPPLGDSVLVPFPFGAALVGAGGTLTCTEPQVVVKAELLALVAAVNAYNGVIAQQATNRRWAYVSINGALDTLRGDALAVRPFPLIGAPCTANPFGTAFSCDAVHPSASTHKLIANRLREAINNRYGTTIPVIP